MNNPPDVVRTAAVSLSQSDRPVMTVSPAVPTAYRTPSFSTLGEVRASLVTCCAASFGRGGRPPAPDNHAPLPPTTTTAANVAMARGDGTRAGRCRHRDGCGATGDHVASHTASARSLAMGRFVHT